LTNEDDVIQQAANHAIQIFNKVDVLVNNAGTGTGIGPVEEIP
jgi:NAD(P)-dependent dehydrogenase (short-subunit alcohol dehydrogenase family)